MTILVGYKRTPEGQAALGHGLEAASSTGAPLAIFPLADRDEAADLREDAALNAAIEAGATLLQSTRGGGHPAEELLDTAAEHDVALIVIGVRNRSRVSKLLLGSDAQSIILGATAPVLTVKVASDDR
ncbi:universal stress protein [Arthrobacter crystallopoietes]|uniref:universal stress protein n=1 Tax=Crystallibacter crystallopoietes TaxID=37928 RepID=UPI001ABDF612|nr:universal stress protein [Arthrobacter crystallopoietes]QTG81604.1 universal stress protein [Arthrobacter crystallopoietes]